MVELLLQRREIIEKTSDIDLTEYQKTLDLTVEDVDIEGDKAEVCVKVLKEWHYSFSPEVGSAAEDKFVVSLEKEAGEWKISAISGLADIVMDETLSEMGDEITSREREEYINEIADEYDYDLEMEDTYEEIQKRRLYGIQVLPARKLPVRRVVIIILRLYPMRYSMP